ncbi:hypothetical protein K1T71_004898 [Dendrolimus kikuchii]|uniref:Uncharacterized protein n=1 Tax=Dendrolimus kikuchii TaxID=765133 RepID=A0ACC1D5P7_9NEOP|nr:hypothetical protein K1T71_004898 [Dendrolimus kikuchii]
MSTWVKEDSVTFFQLFCIRVLKTGRIPQHIAFIMDGNRRYAKKRSVDTKLGHYRGFDKLSETLKWCLDLGVPEVTIYAFSIENFKRTKDEVDALMELAKDKFQKLLEEIEQINEWGVRVHVAGRISLLPPDLRKLVSQAMIATKDNNKLRLNIAYAYTARDEISRAASCLVDGVKNHHITPQDIDEELLTQAMDLAEPELLIRTSGEIRLSDFMLWQVSNTMLYFSDVLWPEYSIWNLLAAIIHFQRYAPPPKDEDDISPSKLEFLEQLNKDRWQILENYVNA